MKYSIDLQSPLAYSSFWLTLGVGLIVLALAARFFLGRLFSIKAESPFRLDKLHRSSLKRIGAIEKAYGREQIGDRTVHQQMSREVRRFVDEVTGLNTGAMVYEDLKKLGRTDLADLIREYYGPEFAESFPADTKASLEKGKALVDAVYQRAAREQYIYRTAERQEAVNRFLSKVTRFTPYFLWVLFVRSKIRHNSLTWMERIQLAFQAGDLDPRSTIEQVSRAARSFLCAVYGESSAEKAFSRMQASRKGTIRLVLSHEIGMFFEPAPADCTPEDARTAVEKGKELVKKWK